MKYVYSATYKNYENATVIKEVRVVASTIDRAIIAIRKCMKRNEYSHKEILSIERGQSIAAVE